MISNNPQPLIIYPPQASPLTERQDSLVPKPSELCRGRLWNETINSSEPPLTSRRRNRDSSTYSASRISFVDLCFFSPLFYWDSERFNKSLRPFRSVHQFRRRSYSSVSWKKENHPLLNKMIRKTKHEFPKIFYRTGKRIKKKGISFSVPFRRVSSPSQPTSLQSEFGYYFPRFPVRMPLIMTILSPLVIRYDKVCCGGLNLTSALNVGDLLRVCLLIVRSCLFL